MRAQAAPHHGAEVLGAQVHLHGPMRVQGEGQVANGSLMMADGALVPALADSGGSAAPQLLTSAIGSGPLDAWLIEAHEALHALCDANAGATVTGLSYDRLRTYRDDLTRALNSKIQSGVESPQAFAAFARGLQIAPPAGALLHSADVLVAFVRDVLLEILDRHHFTCYKPFGAYYIMTDISSFGFADDVEFARYLVKDVGVAAVPGSSFYKTGAGRTKLRFCFCKKDETLAEADRRLQRLVAAGVTLH
jgi:hypothetical protein